MPLLRRLLVDERDTDRKLNALVLLPDNAGLKTADLPKLDLGVGVVELEPPDERGEEMLVLVHGKFITDAKSCASAEGQASIPARSSELRLVRKLMDILGQPTFGAEGIAIAVAGVNAVDGDHGEHDGLALLDFQFS